jgi:hypothetical protein
MDAKEIIRQHVNKAINLSSGDKVDGEYFVLEGCLKSFFINVDAITGRLKSWTSLILQPMNNSQKTTVNDMKSLLLLAFMLCTLQGIKAQNQTKMEATTAITQVLDSSYFKGIYEGDTSLLKQIFNTGTLLFGDVKGQPYAKTLDQYLDGVAHRQSPKDSGKPFKGEILSIRIVNSIAVAEVTVKMYDFNYHEFLSFHLIDGKWLIVNKMISDVNK